MKRYLYLWHRWLGIFLCLLMALWFVSGLVMMYVGYPKLTPREHLAHLPPLLLQDCCVPLAQVLAATGQSAAPMSIRLTTVAGEPRFVVRFATGAVAVDARSGKRIDSVTPAEAVAAAQPFAAERAVHYQASVSEDAWTHSRALDGDRPLHRVGLDDGTLLYVSGRSGEVVRDATFTERTWNWLGAWLHWVYPLRGGVLDRWWSDAVIYLSVAATLMTLLGMVVGILRWRFATPYRSGARSPYKGLARWHHIGGLLFGGLALAWIFSGLMSMNPWRLLDSATPLNLAPYQGGALQAEAFSLGPEQALPRFNAMGLQVHELHWHMLGGRGYLLGLDGSGASALLAMDASTPQWGLDEADVLRAAQAIRPEDVPTVERLTAYDFYYYARAEHSMTGHLERPLPILRVRFNDPAQTWLHLDPRTGALLGRMDEGQRTSRWLFALLHSWDWLPLLQNRPLWDGWMWLASLGGLLICLSGTVMGWRRLRGRRPVRVSKRPCVHPSSV